MMAKLSTSVGSLSRLIQRGAAMCLLVGSFAAAPYGTGAQELIVDRWLVTGVDAVSSTNLLGATIQTEFPGRNLTVGPGLWTLVREDGQSRFAFSDYIEPGQTTLAHVYLKALADLTAHVSVKTEACASVAVWLNGQTVPDPTVSSDVRLSGGWNTFLAVLSGTEGCAPVLAVEFSDARGLVHEDEESLSPASVRVQASRPPGIRRNFPEGTITVSEPVATSLAWGAGQEDLIASFRYSLATWGRHGSSPPAEGRLSGPPEVDLTGTWDLTLFSPTGIQRTRADLTMDEDGTLFGELRRDLEREGGDFRDAGPFEGPIRDGWVSQSAFGWIVEFSGRGGFGRLEFSGTVVDGELQGSIDFGDFRDFTSRFEGRRRALEGSQDELERETPDTPPQQAQPPDNSEIKGALGAEDELSPPSDPDGQRARMVRQLIGPPARVLPAPTGASARVSVAGESYIFEANELTLGKLRVFDGTISFRKLRDASLRDDGVVAEIKWTGGDRKVTGRVSAASILRVLHSTLNIMGLKDRGDGFTVAQFRVPNVLIGFTIQGDGGEWLVDGRPALGGVLCDPCERGRQLELGFRGSPNSRAQVRITNRGWPDVANEGGGSAIEWLRVLEGDNRKYRERAGG